MFLFVPIWNRQFFLLTFMKYGMLVSHFFHLLHDGDSSLTIATSLFKSHFTHVLLIPLSFPALQIDSFWFSGFDVRL